MWHVKADEKGTKNLMVRPGGKRPLGRRRLDGRKILNWISISDMGRNGLD
jgi:hypothetical protein